MRWAKQRKDEAIIDVHDIQLGHTTKLRWNSKEAWVWSELPVHETLAPHEAFDQAQQLLAARGRGRPPTSRTGAAIPTSCAPCCFVGSANGGCRASGM